MLEVYAPEAGSGRLAVAPQHESVSVVVNVERVFVDERVAAGVAEFAETE